MITNKLSFTLPGPPEEVFRFFWDAEAQLACNPSLQRYETDPLGPRTGGTLVLVSSVGIGGEGSHVQAPDSALRLREPNSLLGDKACETRAPKVAVFFTVHLGRSLARLASKSSTAFVLLVGAGSLPSSSPSFGSFPDPLTVREMLSGFRLSAPALRRIKPNRRTPEDCSRAPAQGIAAPTATPPQPSRKRWHARTARVVITRPAGTSTVRALPAAPTCASVRAKSHAATRDCGPPRQRKRNQGLRGISHRAPPPTHCYPRPMDPVAERGKGVTTSRLNPTRRLAVTLDRAFRPRPAWSRRPGESP